MKFNVDRLSTLAGLPDQGSRVLNEASNRSMHDDPALKDDAEHRFGKNQISEERGSKEGEFKRRDGKRAGDIDHHYKAYMDSKNEMAHGKHDDMGEGEHAEMEELAADDVDEMDDVVLEIDETMLKNEIRRMRQQRLQENKLRMAIRGEIKEIFEDLGIESDSSWVYGDDKPRNSKAGFVNTAFPGIGFR